MQIQKGLVKYKDRTDIVCTYGLTEDGKQYYFLDESSIPNGNIIASTALVEAVDPVVVASSVGVIDREGNVVIPFENKAIKPIGTEFLLVEKATATTPSVIEAINLRGDPLAATRLVTTPATIKDNMNAKMGEDGRFIFNDQFSEATIYDINGKNVINNEYYSFIGIKNNETLYFSKNTVDSPVIEFSLSSTGQGEEAFPSNSVSEKLDVQNTDVTQETIDGAMNGDDLTPAFGDIAQNEDGQVMVDNETSTDQDENIDGKEDTKDINSGFSLDDVAADIPNNQVEMPVKLDSLETNEELENVTTNTENVEDTKEDAVPMDKPADESGLVSLEEKEPEVPESSLQADKVNEDELVSFDFKDNINYDSTNKSIDKIMMDDKRESVDDPFDKVDYFKKDLLDTDLETDVFADSVFHADKIINDTFDDTGLTFSTKDTIIEDVASTLSNLIKLNKAQKEKIAIYEEKLEQLVATYRNVVEKARSQVRDLEMLKSKVKNYEAIVSKLESKIQTLEDKIHTQDRLIASQSSELESLRPQIEGKRELARILADAQDLLDHVE